MFCLLGLALQAGEPAVGEPGNKGYPIPSRTEKLMFYVQRTHNRNTVVYELNLKADGTIDRKEPLHASWIRFEEGGVRKELTYVQNRVYGLDFRTIDPDTWLIKFRQYKKREIYLVHSGKSNTYRALIRINGKMAEMTGLFICSVTNALGIPSSVKYIDILGIDPATGESLHERVIP